MTLDDSELATAKDEPLTLLEVLEGGQEGIAENTKKQKGKINLRYSTFTASDVRIVLST